MKSILVGILFGFGIGIASPFLLLASIIEGHNLIKEIFDRMNDFWKINRSNK